ncbi:MAG TPA: HAMP domain-containing sensor histidine kinase [Vicinamibacterales bacterium]|jgi:signal transduction histidine kinase
MATSTPAIRSRDRDGAVGEMARFIRIVAHDLRAPVTVTRTMLSVLAQGYAGPLGPPQADLVGRVERRLEFLQTLIDDLLDLASAQVRLEDDVERRCRGSALDDRVSSACARIEAAARETRTALHCGTCPEPVVVAAEPDELDLVLDNLLSNAVKYAPGGEVRVSVARSDDVGRLVVADDGIGIPEGAHPRLFEGFFRAANAKAIEPQGTGLGLAIVKAVVDRRGGTIDVESTEGEGTTVTLRLPLGV